MKSLRDYRADATDYLDTILQPKFIFSVFNNVSDMSPAAETGRITRMAQPDLCSGLSFHRWASADVN